MWIAHAVFREQTRVHPNEIVRSLALAPSVYVGPQESPCLHVGEYTLVGHFSRLGVVVVGLNFGQGGIAVVHRTTIRREASGIEAHKFLGAREGDWI